jgi:hypothetical protein
MDDIYFPFQTYTPVLIDLKCFRTTGAFPLLDHVDMAFDIESLAIILPFSRCPFFKIFIVISVIRMRWLEDLNVPAYGKVFADKAFRAFKFIYSILYPAENLSLFDPIKHIFGSEMGQKLKSSKGEISITNFREGLDLGGEMLWKDIP